MPAFKLPPRKDLSPLILEVEGLMFSLQISRWSHLRPWADCQRPQEADEDELELLIERLCAKWADGQRGEDAP